ncbi:MAG: hypothetical protein H5T49_04020 [Hadesarchaea archaeon]|nr:hypothetical protein [Hadesarchaea archaeon]
MEIPELGIKDSKLAKDVVEILQSTDDKFDLAHKMVAIADERIRNQTTRDVIDIAIEMARNSNFSLTKEELRKIKQLLLKLKKDIELIESGVTDNYKLCCLLRLREWAEDCFERIPKTVPELVLEKLEKGEVHSKSLLTRYWLSSELYRISKKIDFFDKSFSRLQKTLEKIAKIAGLSGLCGR